MYQHRAITRDEYTELRRSRRRIMRYHRLLAYTRRGFYLTWIRIMGIATLISSVYSEGMTDEAGFRMFGILAAAWSVYNLYWRWKLKLKNEPPS